MMESAHTHTHPRISCVVFRNLNQAAKINTAQNQTERDWNIEKDRRNQVYHSTSWHQFLRTLEMAQTHKHAHCSELSRKLLHRKRYAEMTDLIKYLKMAHANKKYIYCVSNELHMISPAAVVVVWGGRSACECMHKKCVCCVCLCMCTHPRTGKGSVWEMTTAYLHYYTKVKADEIPLAAGETNPQHTVYSTFTANKCQENKTVSLNLQMYSCLCLMLQRLTQRDLKGLSDQISCILLKTEGINKTSGAVNVTERQWG